MIMTIPLPQMIEVTQTYPASSPVDYHSVLAEQFHQQGLNSRLTPGMRIAVGVGSRGITNLKEIARAALDVLIAARTRPFIIPAMGSHGGATPEGQAKVLAEYGITEDSLGVRIEAGMDVEKIGTGLGGRDVYFSVPALRADAVIVINRIKPHTDFRGTLGSGIQKMLVIGFGKQAGAASTHRAAAHFGYEPTLREFAKVILQKVNVLCGIAILEDHHHMTAELKVLQPDSIAIEETSLLEKARSLMPRLPLDEIDLLIVDRIGKEISGSGMDTNIIGRDITGYSTSLQNSSGLIPDISRIFVRDLTEATKGNGIGIGLADFTTDRAVKALDLRSIYVNATTSLGLNTAKIPIHFPTDREVLEHAISTLASPHPEKLRIVRIKDTLNLERILVSKNCSAMLESQPGICVSGRAREMRFDKADNLLPF